MWILICTLLQKPANLDLHCLQEKPVDQDPYCLQELIYIWFQTVLERINCLSTERYKLICSFCFLLVPGQVENFILLHEAIGNVLAYLFTPIVCLELADFIVPEANLIPLLTFERVHFAKFHFHHSVFLRNTGLGTDILFIKLELYCVASKKKSIPDWHLFITQMKMKWTKWYAITSHVFA